MHHLSLNAIFFKHSVSDNHAKILEILNTTGNFITYLTTAIVSGQDLSFSIQLLTDCYKILRRVCTTGISFQNHCINLPNILNNVQTLLCSSTEQRLHLDNVTKRQMWTTLTTTTWQFLANSVVWNEETQRIVWFHCKTMLCNNCKAVDVCRMIVYNIFLGIYIPTVEVAEVLSLLLESLDQQISIHTVRLPEYLQIFLEYFCIQYKEIKTVWAELPDCKKRLLLYFTADHIKQESVNKQAISTPFMQLISHEFKRKSDCVLKTVTSYVDTIQPKTVIALLDVLTAASCNAMCMVILSEDGSLFLNAGCLLQAIHHCGRKSENIFTPMAKLDQLAPNSLANTDIEREISYDIKSKLMQLIGNLAAKNRKNQDLVNRNCGCFVGKCIL